MSNELYDELVARMDGLDKKLADFRVTVEDLVTRMQELVDSDGVIRRITKLEDENAYLQMLLDDVADVRTVVGERDRRPFKELADSRGLRSVLKRLKTLEMAFNESVGQVNNVVNRELVELVNRLAVLESRVNGDGGQSGDREQKKGTLKLKMVPMGCFDTQNGVLDGFLSQDRVEDDEE